MVSVFVNSRRISLEKSSVSLVVRSLNSHDREISVLHGEDHRTERKFNQTRRGIEYLSGSRSFDAVAVS